MIEVVGDLWDYPADFRVITTNGYVRRDGCAVMGRGCAKEATGLFPKLAHELGQEILRGGNRLYTFPQYGLFTFPVKHRWDEPASPMLIQQSVGQFLDVLLPTVSYVMPRPGCGNGRLLWRNVRPLLECLPDNVNVITFG